MEELSAEVSLVYSSSNLSNRRKIKILLVDSLNKTESNQWKWSGSLELSTIGNQHFLCVTSKGNQVKFLRATTIVDKSILYTIIEEQTDPNSLGYRILNDYPECSIRLHQNHPKSEKQMHIFNIDGTQQKGFSWQKPLLNKEIKFYIIFKNPLYDILTVRCQPDKVNTVENFSIQSKGRPINSKVSMRIFMDGSTRVIRFFPFTRQEEEAPKQEVEKFSFTMNVPAVGISFISTIKDVRKEVLFMKVKDFEFMWVESTDKRTFHMRVRHLQIDNNSSSQAQYPVLFTPYNKINAGKPEASAYFINALVAISLKDKKVTLDQ